MPKKGELNMNRSWKLGDDLNIADNLLDGITFNDLIVAVHCNCREITPEAVQKELDEIMDGRLADMRFLLENNMKAIILEARKGRE